MKNKNDKEPRLEPCEKDASGLVGNVDSSEFGQKHLMI